MTGTLLVRNGIFQFGRVVTEGPSFDFAPGGARTISVSIFGTTNRRRPVVLRQVGRTTVSVRVSVLPMKLKAAREFRALLVEARQLVLENPQMSATKIGGVKVHRTPQRLKVIAGYHSTVAFGMFASSPLALSDPHFNLFIASLDSAINTASGGTIPQPQDAIRRPQDTIYG